MFKKETPPDLGLHLKDKQGDVPLEFEQLTIGYFLNVGKGS